MIELIKNTKIDFMGKRFYVLALALIFIALGSAAIVQIANNKANLGIDFVGGTAVQIEFSKRVAMEEVRTALHKGGITDFDLQDFPLKNQILITIKKGAKASGGFSGEILSILRQRFSGNKFTVLSTTEIGPRVGAALRGDALKAIIAALIGILIYIWWRFRFIFSIGATIATFHDVLAVLGIFYVIGREINLIFVSALLMIAGYSLTDTVVVFDRIRENMKTRYKEPAYTVINQSINEVLSRTLITSLTTFFPALALFVFGGEVIHDFSLAIMLGIIVGTGSSIFIASPVVLMLSGKKVLVKK
jgi:preprotein translocase subunit SecF